MERGLWLPEAPGEAGLLASATPQAPFFSPSMPSLCCEKCVAAWKSDARGGLRASLCHSHGRPRLPAQTRGLGPPV